MVRKGIKVNFDDLAKLQLKKACDFIKKDSLKNADKVKKEILESVQSLAFQPEKYPPDKYKISNDGSYRAFELHHFRIVYKVLQAEIRIIIVRHTKMEPLEY